MIINKERKFLFIEIPLTGSWAVRNELCTYYGGIPILHKHANYYEAKKFIGTCLSDYFIFATVRNPLDVMVSEYFKLKTDHKQAFSSQDSAKKLLVDYFDYKKFKYIQNKELGFDNYFMKYKKRIYSSLIDIGSNKFNYVMRFEHLQDDYKELLSKLDFILIRAIPVTNITKGRDKNWEKYYTPELIQKAKIICGPFMKKWRYKFPSDWGEHKITTIDRYKFNLFINFKAFYSTNFRYKNDKISLFIRKIRSKIFN